MGANSKTDLMQLVIDIGNSRVKCGLFSDHGLQWGMPVSAMEDHEFHALFQREDIHAAIFSSSGQLSNDLRQLLEKARFPVLELDHSMPLPFRNHYLTPESLGLDRLANVAGAQLLFPEQNCLVIDVGTCITYDLLEAGMEYKGGIISPGLEMRAKAMNHFTARLPKVSVSTTDLLGVTTEQALQSGTFNACIAEIDGIIKAFNKRYNSLNVIMTGGDLTTLQGHVENGIFARPYLQLEGLNELLLYQLSRL